MSAIQIELQNARGFGVVFGRWNDAVIDFGEASLREIIDALGKEKILAEIGKEEAVRYFEIEEAD